MSYWRPPPKGLWSIELRPTHLRDMETGRYLGILEWDRHADQAAHDRLPRGVRDYLNDSAVQWDAQAVERALVLHEQDVVLDHMRHMEALWLAHGATRVVAFARHDPDGRRWREGA